MAALFEAMIDERLEQFESPSSQRTGAASVRDDNDDGRPEYRRALPSRSWTEAALLAL